MTRREEEDEFGRRLLATRLSKGMSQAGLARMAGIAPSYLSRIETGKVHPTLQTAARIAAALRTSLDDLVNPPLHKHRGPCPVSRTGTCMMDLLRPEVGPLPKPGEEGYTPRQLRLLRRVTDLIGTGSPDLIKALEVLVGQMTR